MAVVSISRRAMQKSVALWIVALSYATACAPEPTTRIGSYLEPVSEIPGLKGTLLEAEEGETASFGTGVALSGDAAFVGAPDFVVHGVVSGGVFRFVRGGESWRAEDLLVAPEPTDGELFGASLAASQNLLAVGGPYPASGSGRVWIFNRVSDVWLPEQSLVSAPRGRSSEVGFARSLAMSHRVLVVGSEAVLSDGETYEGLAYVFERTDAAWGAEINLLPDPSLSGEALYGWAVAVNDRTAAVGAPSAGTAGAVYLFNAEDGWRQAQVIDGARDAGASPRAGFGQSLAMTDSMLLVGAPDDGGRVGAVYAFEHTSGTWTRQRKLVSRERSEPDGAVGDAFGLTLGISLGRVFVGAPATSPSGARVHVFDTLGATDEVARLKPLSVTDSSNFGTAISATSSTILVGGTGNAYVFELALGSQCNRNSDCPAGHCVDGICCDSECVGACMSCLAVRKAWGESGTCGHVRAGTDPGEACPDSPDPCGTTGLCDGAGKCALPAADVQCAMPSCATPHEAREPGHCDGEGGCVPGPITPCESGHACLDKVCTTDCTENRHCSDGFYCLDGDCVAGPACSGDRREAYDQLGRRTRCGLTYCREGACPPSCQTADDCVSGICDGVTGTCSSACSEELACSKGAYCLEGTCVTGDRCSQDARTSYDHVGTPIACNLGYCRDGTCAQDCQVNSDCISGLCNTAKGSCLLRCQESSDCETGGYCLEGTCVTGENCSSDRLMAYDGAGQGKPCDVYCTSGRCPHQCERTQDCVFGLCHPLGRVCVPPEQLAPSRSEAGCSMSRSTKPTAFVYWGVGLIFALRRRKVSAMAAMEG